MPVPRPQRKTYTFKTGDSWSSLAKIYNVKIQDLIRANPSAPRTPQPGTVIRVPEGTGNRIPSTLTSNYAGMSPSPATIQNRTSNAFNVPAATGPFPAATGPFPAPYSYPRSVRYDVPQQGPLASTAPMPGQREQYLNIWGAAQQGQMFPSIPEWYRIWQNISPENMLQAGYVINPATGIWTQTNPQATGGGGYGGPRSDWMTRNLAAQRGLRMEGYGGTYDPNAPGQWLTGNFITKPFMAEQIRGAGRRPQYKTTHFDKATRRRPGAGQQHRVEEAPVYSPTGRMSDYAAIGLVSWRI